jgi:hypothetical protein
LTNLAADNGPDSCAHACPQNIRFTAGRVNYGSGIRDGRGVNGGRRLIHGRVVLGCRTLYVDGAIDINRPLDYHLALYVHRPFGDSMRRITAVDRTLIPMSPLPPAIV